ncbi:hypothetical protein F5Y00DRAFT_229803 [Daldinia vernicosa]|uniref:uncharacterized protein n=1 Tax=Daldinia vernicosa TaxID=114800 RepID=UPI0020079900|nr:uncharacterized protein F5Y00DRAFT_229803 [Daldinia vernicosa]KAI0851473.1 hypothetical protein F5Y00DRAFT_229803 [Daldinia vernicosa]
MTSYHADFPGYTAYPRYFCPCGGPLDIRYQYPYQPPPEFDLVGGYCHACHRQIPHHRMILSDHMPYPASYSRNPWYIDNGYYHAGPEAYTWGPQHQLYQHPGIPPRVSHTYHSPTAHGSLYTQHPYFTSNTSHYQNGYEVPRSTGPRQQWSTDRSENPRLLLSEENLARRRSLERRRERSYSWERSGGPQSVDDPTNWANSICDSVWSTQTTAGYHQSSSEFSSTINRTPSPEPDEENIGAGYPCETEDRQDDAVEGDDEEEPFTVARDGTLVLLGDQWQVPSPTAARSEAGNPVGYCDITSTHQIIDEDGNITEVDIKEKNCKVSRTMSGGLAD